MEPTVQVSPVSKNGQVIERAYYEDEISLFEVLSVIWRRKMFIICFTLSCILLSGFYLMFNNDIIYKTSAIISLNFPGIETYTNPDNTTFDKSQMISPVILSKVNYINKVNDLSKSASNIEMISIEEVIPDKIRNEMKKNPGKTYLTNRFLLSLSTDNDITFSENERSKIISSIIEEYKNNFYDKYVKTSDFTETVPETFLEKNDYIDVIEVLKIRLDNAVNLLNEKLKTSGNFRLEANNKSFADLKGEFEILKNVELAKIEDIVLNLSLTKEKSILIIKLNQKIKNLDTETQKENGKARIAQELLEKISSSPRNAANELTIPTGTTLETTFIEKLRKEDNVSYLIKTILASKARANELLIEKNRVSEIINGFEKELAKTAKNQKLQYVESSLSALVKGYNSLTEELNTLSRAQVNSKFSNAIKIEQNPITEITSQKNTRLVIAITGLGAFFMAVFAAFLIEYISNARKENQQAYERENGHGAEDDLKKESTAGFKKFDKENNVA